MSIELWNERYLAGEQLFEPPSPLVERFAANLEPQAALDLACGPGRNALYLAERGWSVVAVDGSPVAISVLEERARRKGVTISARVADLERGEFEIQPGAYGLICACYYLQRSLLPRIKTGLKPGGMAIAIVHLAGAEEPEGTPTRARPGELRDQFAGWGILHYYEGQPQEACHQRPVAELVATSPC